MYVKIMQKILEKGEAHAGLWGLGLKRAELRVEGSTVLRL